MQKLSSLVLALCISTMIHGQDTANFNFGFNHLAISVKDVDASAAFYIKTLHLREITNRSKLEGVRWFSIGEGQELHLISFLKEKVTINKAVHLALTTTKFDDFVRSIEALKVPYSDWPGTAQKVSIRADGIKQVFFQDPDGYWIEVNSVKE